MHPKITARTVVGNVLYNPRNISPAVAVVMWMRRDSMLISFSNALYSSVPCTGIKQLMSQFGL